MRARISVTPSLVIFMFFAVTATAAADGIATLIQAGKSMDSSKKELAAETASFNNVKNAVESGAIKRGVGAQAIASQYGQPVVINEDFVTERERWVYKPAGSSFFDGERIYLYFDKSGRLDEMKIIR